MDPNATLANLRDLANAIAAQGDTDYVDKADLADEMAYIFQALDEWITKGGFRPAAWR